jgi:hypothetical protein
MFLYGHSAACADCQAWLTKYGIVLIAQHCGAETPHSKRGI